jgi:hypothetical protein
VDDAKIAELTAEVLADLRTPAAPGTSPASASALEARVAALENAIRGLRPVAPGVPLGAAAGGGRVALAVASVDAPRHPSHELLGPSAAGDRCVLEPDKPCVGSGQCRSFGY